MRTPYPRSDTVTRTDWRDRAQCREDDPEMYHSLDPDDIRDAKYTCINLCPVADQCLDEALATERQPGQLRAGVRGGLTPEERAKIGRPRRKEIIS